MAHRKTEQSPTETAATEREAAIVAAYKAGVKVTTIETEFGVARSTLYHILRRSKVMPARTRKQLDAASRDSAIAALYELIRHQDRLLAEQAATIDELRQQLGDGKSIPRTRKRSAAS